MTTSGIAPSRRRSVEVLGGHTYIYINVFTHMYTNIYVFIHLHIYDYFKGSTILAGKCRGLRVAYIYIDKCVHTYVYEHICGIHIFV